MLKINYSAKFKADYKRILKRGLDKSKLTKTIRLLADEKPLPEKYRDHPLSGNFSGYRECHIQPDWLLVYKIEKNILTLTLAHTGTHSDIFKK